MSAGWIKLYRALLDDPVWTSATADQKAVLVAILLRANHEPRQWVWEGRKYEVQPGQFVTSLSSLAGSAGVSVKSVRSAIARFEKLNFLANESAKTGRLISLKNWHVYQSGDEHPGKEVGKDPAKTGQLTRSKEVKKKNLLIGFDEFWSAYPRKTAKQDATKAWQKIAPSPDQQTAIIRALEQHKASEQWQRDGGQYIPHPATWLNGRRWEDELSTPPKGEGGERVNPEEYQAVLETRKKYGLPA